MHVDWKNIHTFLGNNPKDNWSIGEKVKNGMGKKPDQELIPDLIRIHPENKTRFILNVIRAKELDICPLDRKTKTKERNIVIQ